MRCKLKKPDTTDGQRLIATLNGRQGISTNIEEILLLGNDKNVSVMCVQEADLHIDAFDKVKATARHLGYTTVNFGHPNELGITRVATFCKGGAVQYQPKISPFDGRYSISKIDGPGEEQRLLCNLYAHADNSQAATDMVIRLALALQGTRM